MKSFELLIVTHERKMLSEEVEMVNLCRSIK